MIKSAFYEIITEVPPSYVERLFNFIHMQYLLPQSQRFTNFYSEVTNRIPFLSYVVLNEQRKQSLKVEIRGTTPIQIEIAPIDGTVSATAIEETKQDIVIAIQIFEEKIRKKTLYFAWREGEEIIPEELNKKEKSFRRLFQETQILLFFIFMVFGTMLFVIISLIYPEAFWIAPLVLITVQFIFVFYSPSFIARTAAWHINKVNPAIHLLKYSLPLKANDLTQKLTKEQTRTIKKDIYDEILTKRGQIDCKSAQNVFMKHGITCQSENLSVKKVNVYELVSKVSKKFGFSVPRILVANTMIPNAAAAGPSPNRGVVLITTGLLVQLEEDEIVSILGHEFGHLKGRDPLILYGLTSAEFLFRFYVLFPLFPLIFSSFLFFIYFWVAMGVIFFISKFFEARADLLSAITMGKPDILASALEKIGFQRLLFERKPSFRIQEWLGLDPHPPIYFRVNRLEKLGNIKKIKRPLVQSIKDVISGFKNSL